MGSPDLFKALTQTLRGGISHADLSEDVKLTPYLSIVVAILYMMAVDGDISDRESSQLQSVIGADGPVLQRAVAYAQAHDVEQFLRDAPPLLDEEARLCLLVNVADSLMADGELQKVELALFDRMLDAFGQTRTGFQPHFDAIAAKGRTSVLGDFDAAASADEMTPPKALVVAMLYMMSADGAMATEEVGRLSAAIGGSQALLKASLRYVSQVRVPQFLALAAGLLDKRQRLCVLLNACDAMMSDRQVVAAERELMGRMMAAFGVEAASLDGYLDTIRLKNELPQDEVRAAALASRGRGARKKGQLFERKRTWEEETGEAGAPGAAQGGPLDTRISRTMQDNLDRMSSGFDDEVTLARLERHSREQAGEAAPGHRGNGANDLRSTIDGKGPKNLRTTTDGDGDGDLRATRDAKGAVDTRTATDGDGPSELRTESDANGESDLRTATDADGAHDVRSASDGKGASKLRTAIDGDGAADLRSAADARGGRAGGHALDGGGAHELRSASDAAGPQDLRAATDDQGLVDVRSASDAAAGTDSRALQDSGAPVASRAWQDAGAPADRRDLGDAAAPPSAKHLLDDRGAFDADASDDGDGTQAPATHSGRMHAVRERTQRIRDHLDAMRRSRSLRAGSRLPALPASRARQATAAVVASVTPAAAQTDGSMDANKDDDSRMLLASDEGGPRMSEQDTKPSGEESKTNRSLRLRSAVLLPALFVTYGATMVGETLSERLFITNENIATDARIVHQMASVQQSVYRIAPDAVQLAPPALVGVAATDAASTAASTAEPRLAEPSDREKAEDFLEQRKQELQQKVRQHQGSSAVAAERQQWFVYAKSIVLLGLGMAFWGVLFRSLKMLHASTASGLLGLLLTANGYWLFLRF